MLRAICIILPFNIFIPVINSRSTTLENVNFYFSMKQNIFDIWISNIIINRYYTQNHISAKIIYITFHAPNIRSKILYVDDKRFLHLKTCVHVWYIIPMKILNLISYLAPLYEIIYPFVSITYIFKVICIFS